MTDAWNWNVTEQEYEEALTRSRDGRTTPEASAEYWQLCRYYRGLIFRREDAERALGRLRDQ
jgi:hypothetical protein